MVRVPRRVFLSHTSELAEFPADRSFVAAAAAAVTRAGNAVVDMAYFTAREAQPSAYCREAVRGCGVYVGLIGLRYGSPVRDEPEMSYTELEFDTATAAGLPRLVFVLDEDAELRIPPTRVFDQEADRQDRQRAFRARLREEGVMVGTVASPEQLELMLYQALLESRPAAAAAGGVRVSEGDPRRLGVHAAISVPGVPDEVPPEYVPRDADAAGSGIRARVTAAAERGGFVLLVGGSSVGKTRAAFEAVWALLPDWWLVHPAGPGEVAALAAAPSRQTVVWLDELQRYLDGEHGLTGGMVRALLGAPDPAVVIGTLWPDRYHAYTTVPDPGGPDPREREREVLGLADVIRIGPEFSPAEQDRARAAAARDRRLALALGAVGYGLTQTLAAAPQLIDRWEDARAADPYAWAVLTAALDAARLGTRAPLTVGFLRDAAPGYCTSRQQAEAPASWFEQALAYATEQSHGAAAALDPAGGGMGQIAGYIPADYLIQHASRERRHARVPPSTWDAILNHIRDPDDAARLADSARRRLLYCYAIPLYRRVADAGDEYAAYELAGLLADRGDLDGLRTRADAGGGAAAYRLAGLLFSRGDLDQAEQILRASADAGDGSAAGWLADRLASRGDLDGLRTLADAGDEYAAEQLAGELADRGDLDQLRTRADAGDEQAAYRLSRLAGQPRGPGPAAHAGRRRRQVRRLVAGRPAGRPRGPGPGRADPARPGRRRRRVRRRAAGRPAGRPRGPGPGRADPARPGRRRRRVRRRAAGRSAGRPRGPGRAAHPGRRRRRVRRRAAGRSAGRPRGPGPAARPGRRRRRVRRRAAGRPAGRPRGPGRSCAPGPTPATRTSGGWPRCWRSGARARKRSDCGDSA